MRRMLLVAVTAGLLASLLPATPVAADHINLVFSTQPGDGLGGAPLSTQPLVTADINGAPVNGLAITLSIRPQDNDAGGMLTCTGPMGTTATTAPNGVATFSGCEIDRAQNDYRLRAEAAHASAENSATFDVSVGAAHHLVFRAYPANPTPATFAPQPSVAVVDEGGNTVTTDTRTIGLATNQNGGTFTCTGGLNRAAVAGVATYAGCRQATPGANYTLTAVTTGLAANSVLGANFTVASDATKLLLCWGATTGNCNTSPPSGITGGAAFPTQPHVRVVNASNQTVTSDDTSIVTLAKRPGTPAQGGPGTLTCANGLSRMVTDGIGQFTGCSIDRSGTGYRLRATSPALEQADSSAFTVAVGPAAKLAFLTQPATGTALQVLTPAISVAVQDAGGNTVTSGLSAAITLLITPPNPGGGVLACTGGLTVAAVNGVATFTGCTIDRGGTFTLTATPGGVVPPGNVMPATSAPIVIAASPAQLLLVPSRSVITWADTVILTVQFGANGANRPFTIQSSTDGANWNPTASLVTNAAGQGIFPYRPARNLWYRAVFTGGPGLAAANSNVVRVVVRQIALLRPTNGGRPRFVEGGTPSATVRFTTTVRPSRPELPRAIVRYVVYEFFGSAWRLVSTRDIPVDANGLASTVVTFTSPTRWYVRSQALPTSANANSVWSPVEQYFVGFPGSDTAP